MEHNKSLFDASEKTKENNGENKVLRLSEINSGIESIMDGGKNSGNEGYTDIVNDFSNFFREIESKYWFLYLLSTIIRAQKKVENDLKHSELKNRLNDHFISWLMYWFNYINHLISQKWGWSVELYKSIVRIRKGISEGDEEQKSKNITSDKDFYTFWHLALYDRGEEGWLSQNVPNLVKEKACDGEEKKIVVSIGENKFCIKPERYNYFIPIILVFNRFMSGDSINEQSSNLPSQIGQEVKWDFYMAYKLIEFWQKYEEATSALNIHISSLQTQNSSYVRWWPLRNILDSQAFINYDEFYGWLLKEIEQFIEDSSEIIRLESQTNLIPFWWLKLKLLGQLGKNGNPNIKQQIEELWRKISLTLISYFWLGELNVSNWYIRILSRILDKRPDEIIDDVKIKYENFVTKFVMEPRKKFNPPELIKNLENMIGPIWVIIWYPAQSNVVAYWKDSYYKDLFSLQDLEDLKERFKSNPGGREMVEQIWDILLPYGSFARLTNFWISEGDVALIVVIRGGRNLPPFNEDLLDVITKAIKKEGFNLRALLDFFVIYEAWETKEHLEKVAKVYEAVLGFINWKFEDNDNETGISHIVKNVVVRLGQLFRPSSGAWNANDFSMDSRYHDIGKIGNKPGLPGYYVSLSRELKDEEKKIVELHTILGAALLWKFWKNNRRFTKRLWNASMIALLHHSLSKGYPFEINITAERFEQQKQDRTKQINQIKQKYSFDYFDYALDFLQSLSFEEFTNWINENKAKILAITIADIYDALREDRPYRPGFNPQEAIKILRKELDSLNDPKHPFYEMWKNIEPKLTPQFLEEARKGLI